MDLQIGKLYKLKCNGTVFFREPDGFLLKKDSGDIVLCIQKDKFLDVKKNIMMSPSSMLIKDPISYLYLLV